MYVICVSKHMLIDLKQLVKSSLSLSMFLLKLSFKKIIQRYAHFICI